MPAYLIVRVNVTNPEQYDEYKKLTPAAVAAHGGTFIVRGGPHEVLEGPAEDRRMVVIEFPTADDARSFYDSDAYRVAREVRAGAAEMDIVLVKGS